MNQERQAYRIRQVLNLGLRELSPTSTRRLEAARHLALTRQKQSVAQWVLASSTGTPSKTPHSWQGNRLLRQTLAIAALLIGMWASFYWHSVQYVSEVEATDSALLADDLPPEALLDQDFLEWLKDDSAED